MKRRRPAHGGDARAGEAYRRDRTTWSAFGALFAFGFLNAVLGPALPYIRAVEHISYLVGSLHQVAFALGGGLAGLLAAHERRPISRGTVDRCWADRGGARRPRGRLWPFTRGDDRGCDGDEPAGHLGPDPCVGGDRRPPRSEARGGDERGRGVGQSGRNLYPAPDRRAGRHRAQLALCIRVGRDHNRTGGSLGVASPRCRRRPTPPRRGARTLGSPAGGRSRC